MLNIEQCECGSGLRRVKCCGLDEAQLPQATAVELLQPRAVEATQLFNEKKHRDAEALALKILDAAPNQRGALRVLFEIRKAENKPKACETLARRLAWLPAENDTARAAAQLHLAQLLVSQGRHAEAEEAARASVKLTPRDANVHHVMGVVLTETGRPEAGEVHYRRAIKLLDREDGTVLSNLAWNLKLQGRLNEAAGIYERALKLRPDNARGIGGFAQVEAGRGRLTRAVELLDDAQKQWPQDRTLRLLRALMDLRAGRFDAVLARLAGKPEDLMPPELSARGLAAQRLGQLPQAVADFALGKQMQRERYQQRYEPEPLLEQAEKFKSFFTAEKLQNLPRASSASGPVPIFLLGFSRSGSALLEQLLAKLPGFATADKASPVSALVPLATKLGGGTGYLQALDEFALGDGEKIPNTLRDEYLANLKSKAIIGHKTKFVTDRAADNHWHLGLIKLLFADAPIVHVLRHPLDIMLSNLGQDQKLEGNCGVSMAALARHYDLSMSMIKYFRGQMALRYYPVRYEDLVTSPGVTLRKLLAFLGADPALVPPEALLRENAFVPSARVPAHTIFQEAVHLRGLGRYKTCQEILPAFFNEVRPVLDTWITELGYGDTP